MPDWWDHAKRSAEYHRHIQEDGDPRAKEELRSGEATKSQHPAVGEDWDEVYSKENGARGLFQQHKAGK